MGVKGKREKGKGTQFRGNLYSISQNYLYILARCYINSYLCTVHEQKRCYTII